MVAALQARAWPAPAKLNLFLHITGRQQDGYHALQSVFQFLDYGDQIRVSLRDDGRIRRVCDLPGVAEQDDLVVRAAGLLQQHAQVSLGVDIHVTKRLPMGGGLGGGSSDAATVLLVLNRLWQCALDEKTLAALGLTLGADIPVFLHGWAAWAEGVGERLQTVTLSEPWFVVVRPPVDVSTAAVFADFELTRDCPPITIADFLAGAGSNVCEPVVRKSYPEVAQALAWLNQFGAARLTGTGSCVFAAFAARAEAQQVLQSLPDKWQGFVAQGKNRSPLHSALEAL